MIILPAIDIKDGQCVRLKKGDFSTVHKVAESALDTAMNFKKCGASWIHMVDLDGAKNAVRTNSNIIIEVAKKTGLKVEVGGGIRDMESVDYYINNGIERVILGSAAVKNPDFVKNAVEKYGEKIAVGIDAKGGYVTAEGWVDDSDMYFVDLAKKMEKIGVKTIIFTDISRDGMLTGPNIEQLKELNNAVSCNIIASGGISGIKDITDCKEAKLYGTICGKSVYTGDLNLEDAVIEAMDLNKYFKKSDLIPAIIQEHATGEVLMLAYMNKESLKLTLKTGYTWFYSRSRGELWNKGATSGHLQKIMEIRSDCDDDTLLISVIQTGNACHTGSHNCFFNFVRSFDNE